MSKKTTKNEIKELCNKYNVKYVHEIRPTIFFRNYGVYHMFINNNAENINEMYGFVSNMNRTFFLVKTYDSITSYFKALKRQKKIKNGNFLTLTKKKFVKALCFF